MEMIWRNLTLLKEQESKERYATFSFEIESYKLNFIAV
jgi:hypothetical protein